MAVKHEKRKNPKSELNNKSNKDAWMVFLAGALVLVSILLTDSLPALAVVLLIVSVGLLFAHAKMNHL